MVGRPRMRWALSIGVALIAAAGSGTAVAGPALASSGRNINSSGITSQQYEAGYSACTVAMDRLSHGYPYCLFYSQGLGTIVWAANQQSVGTITGDFEYSNGVDSGFPVRNDAASMIDITDNCNVTTWVSPNYTGNWNWLGPSNGGNLSTSGIVLRNNEASISENNCT